MHAAFHHRGCCQLKTAGFIQNQDMPVCRLGLRRLFFKAITKSMVANKAAANVSRCAVEKRRTFVVLILYMTFSKYFRL